MHLTERPTAPARAWFSGPGFAPDPGIEPGPDTGRSPDGARSPAPATAAPPRLICFPYAGGTPSVYRDWQGLLGRSIRVVPVQLPGRGPRLGEAPYTDLEALVTDLTDALLAAGLAHDYALFGHSMGALLAYEVACALRERGEPEPRHLFVSGSRAPHLYGDRSDHTLADADLRRLVHDLGALDPGDRVGGAYLERRLPVLRADLTACERYRWRPRRPLDCPMTAYSATRDPLAPAPLVEAWRAYTRASLLRRHVAGDHFFLTGTGRQPLLRDLRTELTRSTEEKEPSWTY
ncbi:thioesterase II family protein [Streptomyces sp. NPDC059063]|uniref:thioesterase II family protein n=1 Tax=unclassified Streptomyces TaxID=2593676 RepID=UPI0036CD1F8D